MRKNRSKRTWRFQLTLRSRLVLGYLSVLSIFGMLVVMSGYQITQVVDANTELKLQTQQALAAEELSRASLELIVAIDEGILLKDAAYFANQVPAATLAMEERHALVRELSDDTAPLDFTIASLLGYIKPMGVQSEQGTWEVIQRNRTSRMGSTMERMSNEIDILLERTVANQSAALERAQNAQTTMMRFMILAVVLALFASAYMIYSSIRSITGQVRVLSASANRLASGQLDERVNVASGDEFGQLAESFNGMAGQLKTLYISQESLIAERTQELENLTGQMRASAEVARAATMILDPQELQALVVNLISDRFNFYHTGIFLLDESQANAVLYAASSAGGQRMLERRHKLKVGQGVVGTAIQKGEAHIAQDVGVDAVFFNNPDLPDTRSEVALPLRARGRTIGVLDVQSQEEAAFSTENVAVLQTLADQIALALDNARLYFESQQRLKEVRRLYSEYGQQAWESIARKHKNVVYRYTPYAGVEAAESESTMPALSSDSASQDASTAASEIGSKNGSNNGSEIGTEIVSVPIRIRDQEVGVMRVRKPAEAGEWTDGEIEVLNKLIEQLSVALEGARLYQETQRRAEREAMIGSVTAQIRETLDIETVLKTAAQQVREALGLPEVVVRLTSKPPSGH